MFVESLVKQFVHSAMPSFVFVFVENYQLSQPLLARQAIIVDLFSCEGQSSLNKHASLGSQLWIKTIIGTQEMGSLLKYNPTSCENYYWQRRTCGLYSSLFGLFCALA